MKPAVPLALLLTVATAGCARDDGVYPSLARRPAELRGFAEPAAPPPAPVAADPALDAQVATLRGRLADIRSGFDRAAGAARTAAARAGARTVGSDAWLDAQTLLAQLDDWRAQASSLATDVDGLTSERAAALQPPYPSLDAVRVAATAEVAREDAALKAIAGSLPSG